MSLDDSGLSSPIYLESLKCLSHLFCLKAFCYQCGWEDRLELAEIKYFTLYDFKRQKVCPDCDNTGLGITLITKDKS